MKRRTRAQDVKYNSMRPRRRKVKRRGKGRTIAGVLASVVLLLSVVAVFGILALGAKPLQNNEDFIDDQSEQPPVSAHEEVSYILIVGLDEDGGRTDVIMVACMDHEKGTMNILQIPRDLYIGEDVVSKKVNAVYSSGESKAKINNLHRKLSSHLGIPFDHRVIFTLEGFRNIVDAVDGVDINITDKSGIRVENHQTGKKYTLGPGWVTLDGNKAESFVRKRYGKKDEEDYKLGDISRVQQQRVFYAALAKKLKNMDLPQLTKLATTGYSEISTDMSVGDMMNFAKELKVIDLDNVKISTIPGQFCETTSSFYSIHKQEYVDLFNRDFNPYGDPITVDDIQIEELHTKLGMKREASVVAEGGSLSTIITDKGQEK